MSPGRRWIFTATLPFVCIGGYFLFDLAPSFVDDLYDDFVGPFVLMSWFGLLFSNMYFVMVDDLRREGAAPGVIAAMGGGLALVFFFAGGGPSVIWREPWLFGAAIMPGIDIAWPYVRDRWMVSARLTASEAPVQEAPEAETAAPGEPGW